MAGFRHHQFADISDLRSLLEEQYHLSSILKELVQNADDSGATKLLLGVHPGLPTSAHPLLQIPALLILNDGKFRAVDAEAIPYKGLGAKGNDRATIGKFGRGLKSIFHLCEAFFYLGSPDQEGMQGTEHDPILNPWEGTDIHPNWEGQDKATIVAELTAGLADWPHKLEEWFCLWIPLRTSSMLEKKAPIKENNFAAQDFVTTERARQIATLMPLLRTLRTFEVWQPLHNETVPTQKLYRLERSPDSNHSQFRIDKLEKGTPGPIAGRIVYTGPQAATWEYIFCGQEILGDEPKLQNLRDLPTWPSSPTMDKETGEPLMDQDKAEQHAAVLFGIMTEAETFARPLTVSEAVFLPLSSGEDAQALSTYHLLLHGYFFVDTGRQRVLGRDGQNGQGADTDDRIAWNQALATRLQHPLVIPALQDFAATSRQSVLQIERLTRAMQTSSFYKKCQSTICSQWQWILRVTSTDSSWQKIEVRKPYWTLPDPIPGGAAPWAIIPGLVNFAESHLTTWENMPCLSSHGAAFWGTEVEALLKSIQVREVFTHTDSLRYLLSFVISTNAKANQPECLLAIAREVLKACSIDELRQHKKEWHEFIDLLPPGRCIALSAEQMRLLADDTTLKALFSLSLDCLLLPEEFMPREETRGQLSLSDGQKLLQWLASAALEPRAKVQAAVYFLNKMAGTLDTKRQACGNVSVFQCMDYRKDKKVTLSWNDLYRLHTEGRLVSRQFNQVKSLQQALADFSLMGLDVENLNVAATLFGENNLPPVCDEKFCFGVLRESQKLSPLPAQRLSLFKVLCSRENIGDYKQVLRYLLHGDTEHIKDLEAPLLAENNAQEEGLWSRIAYYIQRRTDSRWSNAPHILVEHLTSHQRSLLGVTSATRELVEALLSQHGAASITGCPLSQEERGSLLQAIRVEALWDQLPFHETDDGKMVPLLDRSVTFLQGNIAVPETLKPRVTILRMPTDDDLRERYHKVGIKEWHHWNTLNIALQQEIPRTYWFEIMVAIQGIGDALVNSADTINLLKAKAWIPIGDNAGKPCDIIYLPALRDELDRLMALPGLKGTYHTEGMFTPAFREHAAYPLVQKHIYPKPKEAFDILGECVGEVDDYAIGNLTELRNAPMEWPRLFKAFEGVDVSILPGLRLLQAVNRHDDCHDYIPDLLMALLDPIPPSNPTRKTTVPRLIQVLNALRRGHAKDEKLFIYNDYLKALATHLDCTRACLQSVPLRNERGQWKEASKLCVRMQGIDQTDVLDSKQETILHNHVKNESQYDSASANPSAGGLHRAHPDQAADVLRGYFAPWQGHLPDKVIGGFLAILGDDPAVMALADECLKPYTNVAGFRETIHCPSTGSFSEASMQYHNQISNQRMAFVVQEENEDHATVPNLLGEPFKALIASDSPTLFIGYLEGLMSSTTKVRLRSIDPDSCDRKRLVDLLRESAAMLLEKVYSQQPDNLETLWKNLNDSEQIDLAVAQEMILDNALFYFGLLDTQGQQRIKELRRKWDNVHFHAAQNRQLGIAQPAGEAERRRDAMLEELRTLIERDCEIQNEILKSVRGKVEQSQYEAASVPFEIFQNADDAAEEWADSEAPANASERLVMRWTGDEIQGREIQWCHWGRPINAHRSRLIPSEEGQRRGYHLDLCKMLTLSSSDKGGQDIVVTGKFGLGFKSVFLLSDVPQIVSGDLAFEVVAGMYPRRLEATSATKLRDRLKDMSEDESTQGTLIVLPLREGISSEDVIKNFEQTAHLLVAFARRIRRIEMQNANGESEVIAWHPHTVQESAQVFVGQLTPSRNNEQEPGMALMLYTPNHNEGSVLLRLDAAGFCTLPATIPNYWVTTPARGSESGNGVAINAPFMVDVGRVQLAKSEANNMVADDLGRGIGTALKMLYTAANTWEAFGQQLGLTPDITPYGFWKSLWILLSKPLESRSMLTKESDIFRRIFWWPGNGMETLLQDHPSLPTELSGDYGVLTTLKLIRYQTRGVLDCASVFGLVSQWEAFQRQWQKGDIVSHKDVGSLLISKKIISVLEDVRLLDVLQKEQEKKEVTPQAASRLAPVMIIDSVKRLLDASRYNSGQSEYDPNQSEERTLLNWLQSLSFLANDGTYQAASDLLICPADTLQAEGTKSEEALCAAFAPANRCLGSAYTADASTRRHK